MIKLIFLIPYLLLSSLHASYHDNHIYYFKKDIPKHTQVTELYRVKIAAFTYHDNAQKAHKKSTIKSYILKGSKYYNLYIGTYHDKDKAIAQLRILQKNYHGAYLVTTYTIQQAPKQKKKQIAKNISKKSNYFSQAKHYFNIGEYESALALFDKEMILHPNNHLASLEYARILYMLGFYKQSKDAFIHILSLNPPTNVQNNIHLFLAKIEDKLSTKSFYGTIMIGSTYDDNLGYNTAYKNFQYGALTLENNTHKTKGFYTNLNLALTHQYTKEDFTWENSFYTYNEFQYEKNIASLNYMQYTTAFSKSYKDFKLTLPLGISNTWFEQKSDNLALFTQPSISVKVSKNSQLSLISKYRHTNNKTDNAKSYDTWGEVLYFKYDYKKSSMLSVLGYEKDKKIKETRLDISKESLYLGGTLNYTPLTDTLLSLHYFHHESTYADVDPVISYAREDKREQFSLGIKQDISKHHALSFLYNYLKNSSNINSYSYIKNSYAVNYHYDF